MSSQKGDDCGEPCNNALLQQSNEDLLKRYPTAWMSRQARNRAGKRALSPASGDRGWLPRLWPIPVASLAIAIAFVVVLPTLDREDAQQQVIGNAEGIRTKGLEPHLVLHRQTPDGAEKLPNGAVASAGDLIRIQYNSAGRAYGVILAIDGRGNLSCHLPEDCGDPPAHLDAAAEAELLPFSVELDDAPRWERLYFVT